jgi:hypothetical protein
MCSQPDSALQCPLPARLIDRCGPFLPIRGLSLNFRFVAVRRRTSHFLTVSLPLYVSVHGISHGKCFDIMRISDSRRTQEERVEAGCRRNFTNGKGRHQTMPLMR